MIPHAKPTFEMHNIWEGKFEMWLLHGFWYEETGKNSGVIVHVNFLLQ